MRALATAALDLVYPRPCAACEGEVEPEAGRHLCWDCQSALTFIQEPFCAVCGDPMEGEGIGGHVCALCEGRKVHFTAARSAVRYRGPARELMQAFKYSHATHLAPDLVRLLTACVKGQFMGRRFDAVTFVPLYARRERDRTYNQSALLAQQLSHALGVAYGRRVLSRVRDTPSQTALNMGARRRNVFGAFECTSPEWVRSRRYLLVDDVITTAATVNECARVLREAGAADVHVVSVARG